MLRVLRNSKAPPKSTPLLSVAGLREKMNPTIPPVKTNPPTTKIKTRYNNFKGKGIIS